MSVRDNDYYMGESMADMNWRIDRMREVGSSYLRQEKVDALIEAYDAFKVVFEATYGPLSALI